MGHLDPPPAYEDLLHEFRHLLDRALYGAALPSPFAMLDVSVMLALLDVSYAAREARPTEQAVKRACLVFAEYAVSQNAPSPNPPRQYLKPVT